MKAGKQGADAVAAQVVKHRLDGSPDTRHVAEAAWLVGADGARSLIRKQLGLLFLGETRDERILLADVEVKGLSSEVRELSSASAHSLTHIISQYWHAWGEKTASS